MSAQIINGKEIAAKVRAQSVSYTHLDVYKRQGYVKAYPKGIRENGGQYTQCLLYTSTVSAISN